MMSTFGMSTATMITNALNSNNPCQYIPILAKKFEGDVEPVSFNGGFALEVTSDRANRFLIVPYSNELPTTKLNCTYDQGIQSVNPMLNSMSQNNTYQQPNYYAQVPNQGRVYMNGQAPMSSPNIAAGVGAMRRWRHA